MPGRALPAPLAMRQARRTRAVSRWALAALALALALAPLAAACTLQSPCVLAVTIEDSTLAVDPASVSGAGPFVLAVANHAAEAVTVTLSDSPLALQVPANGTARSDPFSFSQSGDFVVSAGARSAHLLVTVPAGAPTAADPTQDSLGNLFRAATLLPILVGLALIGIAVLVARTGWQHRHNRIFSSLYLLSGLSSIAQGMMSPAHSAQGLQTVADVFHTGAPLFPAALVWFRLYVVCIVVMLPLLFLFVLNFPRPMPWTVAHPHLQWLAFSVSLLFGSLILVEPPLVSLDVVQEAFNVLATGVILAATFVLFRTQHASPSPIERRQAGYLMLGFFPAFAATGAITLLGFIFKAGAAQYTEPVQLYISPLLELGAAAVTAFAILKYRLLDFELKVKGGMRYALMTVILGTVLFLVEVYVGNFVLQAKVFGFLGPAGSATLAGISGIVLFKPVHKVSGKVTDRLFPEATGPKVDYERQRSREIYQAQATHVLRDAQVTDRELQFLRTLRDQLGLNEAEAQRIEETVERELGVDDERTGSHHMGSQAAPVSAAPVAPAPLPPPEAVLLDAAGQPVGDAAAVASPKQRKASVKKVADPGATAKRAAKPPAKDTSPAAKAKATPKKATKPSNSKPPPR